MVFGNIALPCANAASLVKALQKLWRVCRAWKDAVSILPLKAIVVRSAQQAERLRIGFEERFLAAHPTQSLTMDPASALDNISRSGSPTVIAFTRQCALLLAACSNIVDLSISGQLAPGSEDRGISADALFAPEFLQSQRLSTLRSLTLCINGSTKTPECLVPLLAACTGLSNLSLTATFSGDIADQGFAGPPYILSVFGFRTDLAAQPPIHFLVFALGRQHHLKRLLLPSAAAQRLLRMHPEIASTVEVLQLPLPIVEGRVPIFPQLRAALISGYPSKPELNTLKSTTISELRLRRFHLPGFWAGWRDRDFLPWLRSDAAALIRTLQVEYDPRQDRSKLSKLEVLEDACIARGIEFDLVSEV